MKFAKLFTVVLGLVVLVVLVMLIGRGPEIDATLVSGTLAGDPKESADPDTDAAHYRWLGPDGDPLPFQIDAEVEDFLQSAEIVSRQRIKEGINGVDKLLLEKDGIRAHAAFRDVAVEKRNVSLADGTFSLRFRDDCIFEVAAYRISRLLGLDNVPPVVERRIRRESGTLQLWIEAAFTEKHRIREKRRVPQSDQWRRQVQTMYLFDKLIANDDRNQGNILVDSNWKLWMIDHTRAFRPHKTPPGLNIIVECDREVWQRLQELDQETLERTLKGILTKRDVRVLLERRDALLEHLRSRIKRLGEDAVLL